MPTRQVFHQRLKYLSEQVQKLEKMGYTDKTLHESVNSNYKDKTKKIRILIILISLGLGLILGIVPGFASGYSFITHTGKILDILLLERIYSVNPTLVTLIAAIYDIVVIISAYILNVLPFVIVGLVISIVVKIAGKQKKIDDFNKNSAKMEQNLKEARRIYENIRTDLIEWIPVEHRNSKDLKKMSDCFALYNISSIQEAIELMKAGKV